MSVRRRIVVFVAAAVVLVAALLALRPAEEARTPTTTAPARAPEPEPEPEVTTIRIRDGAPAGAVRDVEVATGQRVRLAFDSDVDEQVHIHGYDRYVDLRAGETVRETFTADAEGIFEVELHGSGAQVARLVVEPG